LVSRVRKKYLNRVILVLIAVLVSMSATLSSSGPIGEHVRIIYSDLFVYLEMIKNPEVHSGSILLSMAFILQKVSYFFQCLEFITKYIPTEWVYLGAYFINQLIIIIGIYIIVMGFDFPNKIIKEYAPVVILFSIIVSTNSVLFNTKLLNSTIAISLSTLQIAVALRARWKTVAIISFLIGTVHPSYYLLSFCLIFLLISISESEELIKLYKNMHIPKNFFLAVLWQLIAIVPLAVLWTSNIEVFKSESQISFNNWLEFTRWNSSTAFPLQRGMPWLISHLLIYGLSIKLVNNLKSHNEYKIKLKWILYTFILGFILQLLFSEVFYVKQIIQLALTHRVNAIGYIIVLILIYVKLYSSLVEGKTLYIFPLASMLLYFWGRYEVEESSMLSFLVRSTYLKLDLLVPLISTLLIDSLYKGIQDDIVDKYLNEKRIYLSYFVIFFLGINFLKFQILVNCIPFLILKLKKIRKYNILFFFNYFKIFFLLPILVFTHKFPIIEQQLYYLKKYTQSGSFLKTDATNLVIKNVPESEKIILLPIHGAGYGLSVLPERASYIDTLESDFLLYLPNKMNEFEKKVAVYSNDESSNVKFSFLQQKTYNDAASIRLKKDQIPIIDPKAKWVLTLRRYTCELDIIHDEKKFSSEESDDDIVLIKLENFNRNCFFK